MTDATLVAGIPSDVGGLDPHTPGGFGGGNLPAYGMLFGGMGGSGQLVIPDPRTGDWLSGVAESWEMAADGMTWTFKIRPGITFHNGEVLTADDVKFSFDRARGEAEYNPEFVGAQRSQFFPVVDRVEVTEPLTVVVHMKVPDVTLPIKPLYQVPKAYVEDVGDDGFAQNPVGIGPFKFVSWDPGSELVLERHDEFYLGTDDPSGFRVPYIKTLVQKVIPDDAARIAALRAGEIDMAHSISADLGKQMDADPNFQVWFQPGSQPTYISMNTNDEFSPDGTPNPWRDSRVREAANLAVDLDTIISAILTGREVLSFGSNSSGFGFPGDIAEKRFGYDPSRARELLAEAGYPDGFSSTFTGPTGRWPNSRQVMEAVAEYLNQVGIKLEISESQYSEWVVKMQNREHPGLTFMACAGGADPAQNMRFCYHSTGAFGNGFPIDSAGLRDDTARLDDLIVQSENAFDRADRATLLGEIIKINYLNPRHIWLYQPVTLAAATLDWEWEFNSLDIAIPEYSNIKPKS